MSNGTTIRICPTCGEPYIVGQWRLHRQLHPRVISATERRIKELLDEGHSQARVARLVGVTRQRVNQIARDVA